MSLPAGFIEMMRSLLKEEAPEFFEAMQRKPVTSVRLNSRKPGAKFPGAVPVKWCPTGYYLESRPVFTLDPLLHAGAYYVQDASSMIHREVIRRLVSQPVTLLDMCAAPGGKTTAMIDALPDGSKVIANEYVAKRAAILKENLAKWGYPNTEVTNRDSAFFSGNGDMFDIVAVDAPCSGEGMMRKDEDAVSQWSPELIENCSSLQKEIARNAFDVVKPGGYLIYSTCTFNRKENEEVAEYIRDALGAIPVDMNFPEEWGIPGGIGTDMPVYRFMPHRTEGEGLFLAVFKKQGNSETGIRAVSAPQETMTETTHKSRPVSGGKIRSGQPARLKGNVVNKRKDRPGKEEQAIPEIEEILSLDFDRTVYPEADLDLPTAISYLRREAIILPAETPKGLVVITYHGLPLGMAKNIGTRANNLYPKGWRILMR